MTANLSGMKRKFKKINTDYEEYMFHTLFRNASLWRLKNFIRTCHSILGALQHFVLHGTFKHVLYTSDT